MFVSPSYRKRILGLSFTPQTNHACVVCAFFYPNLSDIQVGSNNLVYANKNNPRIVGVIFICVKGSLTFVQNSCTFFSPHIPQPGEEHHAVRTHETTSCSQSGCGQRPRGGPRPGPHPLRQRSSDL